MLPFKRRRIGPGLTLVELLCVMGIIAVLAGLVVPPLCRVLSRARAMKWAVEGPSQFHQTVHQLRAHFQGRRDFPLVTLVQIEADHLIDPALARFLKDRRVIFIPFAGSDPDDMLVIQVTLESGFLGHLGALTATKGRITKPPD